MLCKYLTVSFHTISFSFLCTIILHGDHQHSLYFQEMVFLSLILKLLKKLFMLCLLDLLLHLCKLEDISFITEEHVIILV